MHRPPLLRCCCLPPFVLRQLISEGWSTCVFVLGSVGTEALDETKKALIETEWPVLVRIRIHTRSNATGADAELLMCDVCHSL